MSGLTLKSAPRISSSQFARILKDARAPSAAQAAAGQLYTTFTSRGYDPAVAAAFANKEHSLQWRGVAAHTLGWANIIVEALACVGAASRRTGSYGRFASYRSYIDGAVDWCAYMDCRFVARGYTTVEQVVPIYAPRDDGNDPDGYIAKVRAWVATWAAQGLPPAPPASPPDPWAAWGTAYPLPEEQRAWAIPQSWLRARDLGAATSPEVYVDARPGRAISIQTFAHGWVVYEQANGATSVSRRTA